MSSIENNLVEFNVDLQDSFLFVVEESYEHNLLKWIANMGEDMIDNPYSECEHSFNPSRFCAYLQELGSVEKLVEFMCENLLLFAELIYHVEFFQRTKCTYIKRILNIKKLIIITSFWCEVEAKVCFMSSGKKQSETKVLAKLVALFLSLTYTNFWNETYTTNARVTTSCNSMKGDNKTASCND